MRLLLIIVASWFAVSTCRAELPTLEAVDAMHADAATRIAGRHYDSLLVDADKYLKSHERLPDGRWKMAILLGGMRRGFAQNAHVAADWEAQERDLEALAVRHPASPNAWLFLAIQADSHAWAERGSGFSNTVCPRTPRQHSNATWARHRHFWTRTRCPPTPRGTRCA